MSATYYDRPLLKAPHWGWNVVAYLFFGGAMGGLGIVAALADPRDEGGRRLRRNARIASFALAALNPAILISHLGRPERFLHMLRTFRPGSPMSLGVWGLVAYSGVAGASLFIENRALTAVQAALGAYVTGYTGVLLSATAVPVWGAGKRHIPAASVCSGVASACAIASALSRASKDRDVVAKLERLERVASLAEAAVLAHFAASHGREARRLVARAAPPLLGAIAANLAGSAIGPAATLAAGYLFRSALIAAGKDSANDPRAGSRQPV